MDSDSESHSKTRTLPLRPTPLPCAAARKAPRLCSGIGYLIRRQCRRLHITRGHIASRDGNRHAPYYCWRFGFADRLSRHYPCGPPKTLWFFASARFALLRCKTPKTLAVPFAIRPRRDVTAASRRFSRPHRFPKSQLRSAFALFSVGLRESPLYCTARCAPSRSCKQQPPP